MTICKRLDIAVVPFPFVDHDAVKPRPAVVLSNEPFNRAQDQTILAMITTAAAGRWPSDVAIQDLAEAGLPKVSVIRLKLFTLPNGRILRTIGRLSPRDSERLDAAVSGVLR